MGPRARARSGSAPSLKIACLCVTYLRPRRLAEAIACFEQQDYPESLRELVVLDDAGQYAPLAGRRWQVISTARRFRTLGEKRNAAAALAAPDADAYLVWDDDDIYLPWHVSAAARALARSPWSVPALVYREMFGRLELHDNGDRYYHSAWGFTRALYERAGGYPFAQRGEDQILRERFEAAGAVPADPSAGGEPSYVMRWFGEPGAWHFSALEGDDAYARIGATAPPARVEAITPALTRDWVGACRELLRHSRQARRA
jgi:hypothetical protein